MKSLLCVIAVGALMAAPTNAQVPPAPGGDAAAAEGVVLFDCVCYKDLKNIHPCAVPRIVMVPDPCACNDPCSCCEPKCVAIQICVPPTDECCGPEEKHICKNGGKKQKYCFGKYAVEITVKKGVVVVDYDD
jgi:hypothetical protein